MFLSKIIHGEFTVRGLPGSRKYVVVPPDLCKEGVDARLIDDIQDLWKLRSANLLVLINAGRTNLKTSITEEDLKLDDYAELLKKVEGAKATETAAATDMSSEHLELARNVWVSKLLLFLDALANAVFQTDSWMVHGDPRGGGSAVEWLWEEALSKSGAAPITVVADWINRKLYQSLFQDVHCNLITNGVPGDEAVKQVVELPNIWDNANGLYKSSDVAKTDSKKPTKRKQPEPENQSIEAKRKDINAQLHEMHPTRWKEFKDDGLMSPHLWAPHPAGLFPARSATHYIFFDSVKRDASGRPVDSSGTPLGDEESFICGDATAKPWDDMAPDPLTATQFNAFGAVGNIFIRGTGKTKEKIMTSIAKGMPTILVKNSGGMTQTFVAIHEMITRPHLVLSENGQNGPRFPTSRSEFDEMLQKDENALGLHLLDRANANKKIDYTVTFAEVLEILHHFKTRPQLFHKTIKVINPLKQSPEEQLTELSACFSSTYTGIAELGGLSTADNMVINAWAQHHIVERSSSKHRLISDVLVTLALVCNFSSTLLAVLMTFCESQGSLFAELEDGTWWQFLKYTIIVLPALGGVFSTIISRYQNGAKWGAYRFAGAQIVAEIYRYRMRTGPYGITRSSTPSKASSRVGEPQNRAEGNTAMMSKRMRLQFIKVINGILSPVQKTGMADDAFEIPMMESLANHVDRCVLPKMFLPKIEKEPVTNARELYQRLDALELGCCDTVGEDVEPDNYVQTMGSDTYLAFRVKPLEKYYSNLAPQLVRKQIFLEISVLLSATAGTLLSALNHRQFVPIAVAFGSLLTSWMQYSGISARLAAVNHVIRELQCIIMYAAGLGVVDQRMPAFKTMIVERTESAVLAEYAAFTASSSAFSLRGQADVDQEDKGNQEIHNREHEETPNKKPKSA